MKQYPFVVIDMYPCMICRIDIAIRKLADSVYPCIVGWKKDDIAKGGSLDGYCLGEK